MALVVSFHIIIKVNVTRQAGNCDYFSIEASKVIFTYFHNNKILQYYNLYIYIYIYIYQSIILSLFLTTFVFFSFDNFFFFNSLLAFPFLSIIFKMFSSIPRCTVKTALNSMRNFSTTPKVKYKQFFFCLQI